MARGTLSSAMVLSVILATAQGCALPGQGMEGNIYEKTTIFSLIVLTVFAIVFVLFVGSSGNSREAARFRTLVADAPAQPLTEDDFTACPVYLWYSRRSFQKLLFHPDGRLSVSGITTGNGMDPKTAHGGTWALSDGRLRLTLAGSTGIREYTSLSAGACRLPKVMRLTAGLAEPWFLGPLALAHLQISCFGCSDSAHAAERFTYQLLSGRTVYWASYPCVVPVGTEELSVNPVLAYGMIRFHEDGMLSKSINNQLHAPADYQPHFTGSWRVDEEYGVLRMSVGTHGSEVTLLLLDLDRHTLLAGSTDGAEQWFFDERCARLDLAEYLAEGVYLDPQKKGEFT